MCRVLLTWFSFWHQYPSICLDCFVWPGTGYRWRLPCWDHLYSFKRRTAGDCESVPAAYV